MPHVAQIRRKRLFPNAKRERAAQCSAANQFSYLGLVYVTGASSRRRELLAAAGSPSHLKNCPAYEEAEPRAASSDSSAALRSACVVFRAIRLLTATSVITPAKMTAPMIASSSVVLIPRLLIEL